ncbi:YccT family protein [Photobacterium sanguinicancri]|uniref:YccT family protein n=1 Tax=Photobacterium sanguinicancri TaxID=875932 RepID=UPI003D0D8813
MKLRTAFIVLAAASVSLPALADVTLTLPSTAELILVNGKSAEGNDTLTLKDGMNQVAFRYEGGYRENGDYTLFSSNVMIIKFDGTNADYTLKLPNIKSEIEGSRFNKKPVITLLDENDKPAEFKQDKLIKNGIQFGRNFEAEIAAYNQTSKPAALSGAVAVTTLPAVVATTPTTNTAASVAPQQGENTAESMLNYWYSQADEATKARFKARISQ